MAGPRDSLLSLALAATIAGTGARAPAAPPDPSATTELYRPAETCKPCHPQHYEEWRGSMHAYALEDPVFFAMNALGQAETSGALGDLCFRCHSPLAAASGELRPDIRGPEGLSAIARAGVSCDVCHRSIRVTPGQLGNMSLEIDPRAPMAGGIPDPLATPFHESKSSDHLRAAEFCGACHNVRNQHGVLVEKTFDEYDGSDYPARLVSCITCHMQTYSGRAVPDGPIRARLHRHDFAGVDLALTPFPRTEFQRREAERFLRTAARLEVRTPEVAVRGEPIEIGVDVKNIGSGHNLPTGTSTERQIWLEVTVEADDGSVLLRSGHLEEDGDLPDHRGGSAVASDPHIVTFNDRFLDADGREVHFLWQAAKLEERSIPPLATRSATYHAEVPGVLAAASLRVRVRLLLRAFPPHQLARLGIAELTPRFPVFVLQDVSIPEIRVVDSRRTPGVIRVPEDAPSIAAAIERAREGDEVVVGPGRYRIDRPLDFAGRDIILRSRDGPEVTVIELADSPRDAGEANLVRFAGGESPAARLEGFTLTGGRGAIVDGRRVGGAVVILESHPSLRGNIFRGNRAETSDGAPAAAAPATGGAGGAIFLRGSSSHLRDDIFIDNRTDGEGGAIHAAGGSRALVEGCRIEGNRAARGGGLSLEPGSIAVRSSLTRNRAFDGGGIALRSGGAARDGSPSALVLETRVIANSAARGGGVAATGAAESRFERCIIAGNLGGAVHADGGARVLLPHATVIDQLSGPVLSALGGSSIRLANAILHDNRPGTIVGDVVIDWSIVDDPALARGTNRTGLPVFAPPRGRWERCPGPGADCIPAVRNDLDPSDPALWRRYIEGTYRPLSTSELVDAGDPLSPSDADGTRADLGALAAPRPRPLFIRGDVDGDGALTQGDARLLGSLLFPEGPPSPLPCADAADVDDSGTLSPSDLAVLLGLLDHRAVPLPPPFPGCGTVGREPVARLGCHEARCQPAAPASASR